ncbi:MAG: hypothetical protein AAF570_02465 [Bacteroidota bacterium]
MKNVKFSLPTLMMLLLATSLFLTGCKKEEGCTDPEAINFDLRAEKDDGTCMYANENVVKDDGDGVGTTTWTKDKVWVLDGFVFVNEGQTLTIEPGTVIKGRPGQGVSASALVVARGGTIIAEGTAAEPIIFTSEIDDVTDPNDIPEGTRGLWGGIIILGHASLNTSPSEQAVEGIPTTELRGIYGGTNDDDNSGILKYISVRYGGTDIGSSNEINGVTFGGVGSGTTVEHIEVFNNADDGFEFFGGTVNTKWLCAAFCGDDSYDYDTGYRGKGQFWFVINDANDGDRGGEHDGGTTPEDAAPYATPVIYNATYIGRGEEEGKRAVTFRDNAGGEYHNSIFVDYGKGIDIEILSSGEHSYARFQSDDISLTHNVFWNIADNDPNAIFTVSPGSGVDPADSSAALVAIQAAFADGSNSVENPNMSISRTTDGGLNPNPSGAVLSGAATPTDPWFETTSYKGAFDGMNNWLSGWSALDAMGYF